MSLRPDLLKGKTALVTLGALLTLASCAGKDGPGRSDALNGQCGIKQDTCRSGTPSETGDTASPYEWVCNGRHGGETDSCSVPTAAIEEDEIFAGKNKLEQKVKAAGPLRGKMVVFEGPGSHANLMRGTIIDLGIPKENTVIVPEWLFFTDKYRSVREATSVASASTSWAVEGDTDPTLVAQNRTLFVAAVTNTQWKGSRIWYPDHSYWKENPKQWTRAFDLFRTGKVILASYAQLNHLGEVVPYDLTAKCGLAKEYCYSIIATPLLRSYNRTSSYAAAELGALVFYLFQLWETPRAVVNTLNICAEDVGEPGIDEEFGRGVVSVVCDRVQNRERRVAADSLGTHGVSPVLAQMTNPSLLRAAPQSLSAVSRPSATRFRPFYAVRGRDIGTITGHLGGQFFLKGTDFLVSGGADYTPLGVYSSLLHTTRTPFLELGTKRNLFSRGDHIVSLLGVYGYSDGNGLSAHVAHLGTLYERPFRSGTLSLHASYQQVRGSIGIPGHRDAGAEPVFFVSGNPEVRFSFSLGL